MIKKGEPKQTRTDIRLLSSLAPHRYALGQEMLHLWSCSCHCQTSCIFGPVIVTHAVSLALSVSLSHMLYLWPCHCDSCCIFGRVHCHTSWIFGPIIVTVTPPVSLALSLSHILYLWFYHCQTSFSIFDLVTIRHRSVPLVLSMRPIVLYL